MNIVLDERGKRCPAPVIALGRAAMSAATDITIVVISDDPASASDIPAWCRMRGAEFLGSAPTADAAATEYSVRVLIGDQTVPTADSGPQEADRDTQSG